ncbi:alpha-ketoglutarate-dependent dioxygenase AlkB [Luteolibacter sp. Populi]|uniref:alpha-ketoglutarate-dependent dioxygenase AlkB family protein n=1 Tax=Luteolibacter sp. Populi TaxID=3230487 RepID=UPI003466EBC5
MDLFQQTGINLLPCDGTVIYHGRILPEQDADRYRDALLVTVPWKNDETVIFGKRIVTARKVAWYADSDLSYTYSGTTKQALPWTEELLELRAMVEAHAGASFNACLLNLYHDGSEGMGWHSDDEKSIEANSCIASVSLGAGRKFSFRHKRTKETISLVLENGSVLVMKDETQTHWHHQLPKAARIKSPRINLTFRKMIR